MTRPRQLMPVMPRLVAAVAACPLPDLRSSRDERAEALAVRLRRLGYRVDAEQGLHAVRFIERYCRHAGGRWYGRHFRLLPWEFVLVFALFACRDSEGGRLFRRLWLEVGKKNGKTALSSAILLYVLYGLGHHGIGVYSAASSRDQSALVYTQMASMIRQDAVLRRQARIYDSRHTIYLPRTECIYRALAADANHVDGIVVQAAAIDEVHRHGSRDLWDVLLNGMGTSHEPLLLASTTAGAGREGLAWDEHQHAQQVIEGLVDDDRLLSVIYSVPEDADWTQRSVWQRANPSLGSVLREDDLAAAIERARHTPSEEHAVRRLRLNQWVAAETRWIDLQAWDACGGLIVERRLEGRPFYGGLDISHSRDFTAWALVFPWQDDADELGIDVLVRLWLPRDAVSTLRPQMRPTIEAWVREGWISLTDGDTVDLRAVRDQVLADCRRFSVAQIGYDRFHAHGIIHDLVEQLGEDVLVDVGQMFRTMNAPCKELERLLARRRLRHGGNPVLRWMAANAVAETNQDDLIRPSRRRSPEKIDGLVASLMALERCMHESGEQQLVVYVGGAT